MSENFFEAEDRSGYRVSAATKELWAVELDLLERFQAVCEQENLTYYAMFGTMLGSVRHGGYIPWDDDIDIAMPRRDYDRLRGMAAAFAEPYFLQTPENDPAACPRFIRLRRSDTMNIPLEWPQGLTKGGHMGIGIDILPLDEVPSEFAAGLLTAAAAKCQKLRLLRAGIDENTWAKTPLWKQRVCAPARHVSYVRLTERYHNICTVFSRRRQRSRYFTIAVLEGDHRSLLLARSDFAEPLLMQFEHLQLPVPSGFLNIIDTVWQDKGIPELAERRPHHEGIVSATAAYTEYTRLYTDIFHGLAGKQVLLFGAGDMLRIYLERYGMKYPPLAAFDNDQNKWGKTVCGVPVHDPKELPTFLTEGRRLIIISLYHRQIAEQLNNMGVRDYRIFVDGWHYDD
jgi:lipopolysaccharide cholinephosphotransferase